MADAGRDWLVRVEPLFEAERIGVFAWTAYWSNSAISPPNPMVGPSFGLRLRMFAGIHWSRRKALRAAEAAWRSYVPDEDLGVDLNG